MRRKETPKIIVTDTRVHEFELGSIRVKSEMRAMSIVKWNDHRDSIEPLDHHISRLFITSVRYYMMIEIFGGPHIYESFSKDNIPRVIWLLGDQTKGEYISISPTIKKAPGDLITKATELTAVCTEWKAKTVSLQKGSVIEELIPPQHIRRY